VRNPMGEGARGLTKKSRVLTQDCQDVYQECDTGPGRRAAATYCPNHAETGLALGVLVPNSSLAWPLRGLWTR